MGLEQAAALSIPFSQQDVRQSIPAWLSSQSRYEHVYPPPISHGYKQDVVQNNHHGFWTSNPSRAPEDVDQTSIASVDDNISVGDSAHGSYSSEASSRTSWTSATESSDIFLDEDGKEHLPSLTRVNSYNSTETQEQSLRGIRKDDDSAFDLSGPSCPIESTIQGIKGRVSSLFRLPCPDQRQQPAQGCSRSWTSDANSAPNVQHSRTRRSACASQRSYPPKLKRDTDVTEQFVALLIVFAKRLITAIWPASDCPPMSSDCFGAGVLPLETFIRETLRRSKTSFSTLQVALFYLILLKSRMPQAQTASKCKGDVSEKAQCRAMQCGRRMFLSALMLASKYLQDRNYSTRAWSKISGLRSNEINENEREYLAKINYDLHLSKETFENWSKIVMVLSKLSNEGPCSDATSGENFGPSGNNSNVSLAAMVSQVDFDDLQDGAPRAFTGDWWSSLLLKLEPGMAKDASLADQFLQRYLPSNRLHVIASLPSLSQDSNTPSDHPTSSSSSVSHVDDLNFGDMNNARNPQPSGLHGLQTPQTPVQMSPASRPALPNRPQLGNLPTPQTTPRIPCQLTGEKSCLRMTSLEAMRNLRRQCFRNANLERCPPPQPQSQPQPRNMFLPSMKQFMRSAENLHELSMRSTTPLTGSPVSVASDSTTTTSSTVRSRSSSISSVSSWSSSGSVIPHMRRSIACGLSSPLSRVCSLSERSHKPVPNDFHPIQAVLDESCPSTDIQDPASTFNEGARVEASRPSPTSPEVAAIRGLMSLSTQSETSSQSVTPTPQHLSEQGLPTRSKPHGWPQDHKRKLSKTEPNLQAQVKDLIWDGSWSAPSGVLEDPILPYYGMMNRQLQMTTTLRKENRRPLANPLNSKRLCSLQHSSSTPTALSMSEPLESSVLMCR